MKTNKSYLGPTRNYICSLHCGFIAKMLGALVGVLFSLSIWYSSAYRWEYPTQSCSSENIYGIMFDAGSTGSRIHVFNFVRNPKDKSLSLVSDTFVEIKPGLSAYPNDPQAAANSLIPLLKLAMEKVPSDHYSKCPIALKATAGLRALGDKAAQDILSAVEKLFKSYPFPMAANAVEIMSGADEGVFSWVTLNHLLNLIGDNRQTVAALDLGGGSTQISFVPSKPNIQSSVDQDFQKSLNLLGHKYDLYTHSYLHYGLMAARLNNMLVMKDNAATVGTPCVTLTDPAKTVPFKHGGDIKQVRTLPSGNPLQACLQNAVNYVKKGIKPVPELKFEKILTFSYFYDRAVDTNIIGQNDVLKVQDYYTAASKVCGKPNEEHPFLCMDLCYIYALLTDGYQLPPDKLIQAIKQVKKTEVSWALGAMFDLLSRENII
ncbi:ectonucleoside triphosphate diphosphohydrolase 5-like [Argonauta hians]